MTRPPPSTPSPCIGVCWIDPRHRWCFGCRRTMDEIREWPGMDDAARRRVLEECAAREEAAEPPATE